MCTDCKRICEQRLSGPRQANLVLIAYASSEGSGEPAHPRSLARTSTARSYKHWIKRNLQTENQIPGPFEWLGMRNWNLSWRNARRHKFAWRGSSEIEPVFVFEELFVTAGKKPSQDTTMHVSILLKHGFHLKQVLFQSTFWHKKKEFL